jgi:hypothetical protein
MKPVPVAPRNNGIGTGEGTQNALITDRKRGEGYDKGSTTGTGHHYGQDAAISAGGVGLTEHEHRKHKHERESDLGSNTGIGSNTGAYGCNVPYDSTTGSGHHYGHDAAAVGSAAALGEHEHRKHEREREAGLGSTTAPYGATYEATTDQYGHPLAPGTDAYRPPGTTLGDKLHGVERVNDGMTGAGYDTTAGTTGTGTHHLGRDATVSTGGAGLAEYEYRKHEMERGTGVGGTYPTATGNTENTR